MRGQKPDQRVEELAFERLGTGAEGERAFLLPVRVAVKQPAQFRSDPIGRFFEHPRAVLAGENKLILTRGIEDFINIHQRAARFGFGQLALMVQALGFHRQLAE